MTTDEKMLLLKDLCARLPYGVKVNNEIQGDFVIYGVCEDYIFARNTNNHVDFHIEKIKPYLFPMSSMTEEQRNEFDTQTFTIMFGECICKKNDEMAYGKLMKFDLDFYNKHHLDWIGLIPMGLAIDATGLNIY